MEPRTKSNTSISSFKEFSNSYKPIFETYLQKTLSFPMNDARKILNESMIYSSINKGKRVRPLLAMASSLLFSDSTKTILPFCTALELIHTYSLIHDDLPAMDNDELRRGQPTNHVKYGEDMAILAGDCLLTFAFEILASNLHNFFPPDTVLKSISYTAKESGILGMIGGQVLDIKHSGSQNKNELHQIHKLKTGALIKTAVIVPALLHQAKPSEISLLEQFGKSIGLLFQIVDDILDVTQTSSTLGKTPMKDIEQEKTTYITIYGLEESKLIAKKEAQNAQDILEQLPYATDYLKLFIDFFRSRTS